MLLGLLFVIADRGLFAQVVEGGRHRLGGVIWLFNSDGAMVPDAHVEWVDVAGGTTTKAYSYGNSQPYRIDSAFNSSGGGKCLLRISHPEYEAIEMQRSCDEFLGQVLLNLARPGESYYWFNGLKTPYREVGDAIAIRLKPALKENALLQSRWDSLSGALGLVRAPELADSLSGRVKGWNSDLHSWTCDFFRFTARGNARDGRSWLLVQLNRQTELVEFAGPILSKGMSVENSFAFTPTSSSHNDAVKAIEALGIKIEWFAPRLGIGTLPEESRTRIFEITHQLKETGYFEEISPGVMPLYFEEEY